MTAISNHAVKRSRGTRVFDGMAWVGFAINMIVVAVIVIYWIMG